jgi:hypothetical protein
MAGPTRFELATSGVTGRRSNQLNYDPAVVFYGRGVFTEQKHTYNNKDCKPGFPLLFQEKMVG